MLKKLLVWSWLFAMTSCFGAQDPVEVCDSMINKSQAVFASPALNAFTARTKQYSTRKDRNLLPNRIEHVVGDDEDKKRQVGLWAQGVRPVVCQHVLEFCEFFIQCKRDYGTTIEHDLYKDMTVPQFACRLFEKRPYVFFEKSDHYLLRNGTEGNGDELFEKIGKDGSQDGITEDQNVTLADYLSYDEMAVSALYGLSSGSYFINNGARQALFTPSSGEHVSQGYIAGLVGARFEKLGFMECKHMLITREQNTPENGYGLEPVKNDPLLKIWAQKLYGIDYFPTYGDASDIAAYTDERSKRFEALNKMTAHGPFIFGYLDMLVYKKRLELTLKALLLDVCCRSNNEKKKVYLHMVGLGLGVWLAAQVVKNDENFDYSSCRPQVECMMNVFTQLINSMDTSSIKVIDFSWFPIDITEYVNKLPQDKGITYIVSQRNRFDPLPEHYKHLLLYATYAYDGNSKPGNEGWLGHLTDSDDPVAANGSAIMEIQNPDINVCLLPNVFKCAQEMLKSSENSFVAPDDCATKSKKTIFSYILNKKCGGCLALIAFVAWLYHHNFFA